MFFRLQVKFIILFLLAINLTISSAKADALQPLSLNQAFQLSASLQDSQTILLHANIASGYYLYQDQFAFVSLKSMQQVVNTVKFGKPLYPASTIKIIPHIGKFAVFQNDIEIVLPVISSQSPQFILQIKYQGCSQQGYCYPPSYQQFAIDLSQAAGTQFSALTMDIVPQHNALLSAQNAPKSMHALFEKNNFWLILGFFILGILLSLTPCVLPMIPILSAIILGQKKQKISTNFGLSCIYVLSMALSYAAIGMFFAWLGINLQISLQKPIIVIIVSMILLLMALSMLGFFNLQWPLKLRNKLAGYHQKLHGGSYWQVAGMGCLSTLVLSPCVTPPLVAALSYISNTGSFIFGGLALFVMGLGMGLPLLVIGSFGIHYLPKSGPWMQFVKNGLGILLLVLVLWLLHRVLPGNYAWLLLSTFLIGVAIYLGALSTATNVYQWLTKGIGLIIFILAIMLVCAVMETHGNFLNIIGVKTQGENVEEIVFQKIATTQELNQQMRLAKNRPILLDFYADWCLACKQMDLQIFHNQKILQQLRERNYLLLRVDVTKNTKADVELQRKFQVIGPPTILFFDKNHQEINSARIVGEINAAKFLTKLP